MASWTPGGGAGGNGVAGEVTFALRTGATFLPPMLKEPVFGRNLSDVAPWGEAIGRGCGVFFGDMSKCSEGDEADFLAQRGWIERAGGDCGVEAKTPADLVGHPVADSWAGVLIEQKRFERFFGVSLDEMTDASEGKLGVLWLRGKIGPRIGAVVEHDPAKHAVVIEDKRGMGGTEDEVVVFLLLVIGGRSGEFARHSKVDFEVELGSEGEEHAFTVSA